MQYPPACRWWSSVSHAGPTSLVLTHQATHGLDKQNCCHVFLKHLHPRRPRMQRLVTLICRRGHSPTGHEHYACLKAAPQGLAKLGRQLGTGAIASRNETLPLQDDRQLSHSTAYGVEISCPLVYGGSAAPGDTPRWSAALKRNPHLQVSHACGNVADRSIQLSRQI